MATVHTRPNAAEYYYSWEKMNRSGAEGYKGVITATVDSSTLAATSNRLYTDRVTGDSVVCSGTVKLIENNVYILLNDTTDTENGQWAAEVDCVYMPLLSTDVPAPGDTLYWNATNEELQLTASTHTKCAIALAAKEAFASANVEKMPVRTWIQVRKTWS
jgi:predicted RecA/RadA family phage recombinase